MPTPRSVPTVVEIRAENARIAELEEQLRLLREENADVLPNAKIEGDS